MVVTDKEQVASCRARGGDGTNLVSGRTRVAAIPAFGSRVCEDGSDAPRVHPQML